MSIYFEDAYMFWGAFVPLFLAMNGLTALAAWRFLRVFTGGMPGPLPAGAFVLLHYLLSALSTELRLSMFANTLSVFGCTLLFTLLTPPGRGRAFNCLGGSIIAVTVQTALSGIYESAGFLLAPLVEGPSLFRPVILTLITAALQVSAAVIVYRLILDRFRFTAIDSRKYCLLSFVPLLFLLTLTAIILHINTPMEIVTHTDGGAAVMTPEPRLGWVSMLLLMLFALACLFVILFTQRRLAAYLDTERENIMLAQQLALQRNYVREAQARGELTAAFRHDLNNHLSVLGALLERGELDKSVEYVQKLRGSAECLSFPAHTGNPVLDALLDGKLGMAKQRGIAVECGVRAAQGLDPFDLCVVFGNGLDNAVNGCLEAKADHPKLAVRAGPREGFYLIVIENTCAPGVKPGRGQGTANMRAVAEKYGGTLRAEVNGERFLLSVLLALPVDDP